MLPRVQFWMLLTHSAVRNERYFQWNALSCKMTGGMLAAIAVGVGLVVSAPPDTTILQAATPKCDPQVNVEYFAACKAANVLNQAVRQQAHFQLVQLPSNTAVAVCFLYPMQCSLTPSSFLRGSNHCHPLLLSSAVF
jgi:hypothetical protein